MKARILILPAVLIALVVPGCGQTQAQEEASSKAFYEQEQHEKHEEAVKEEKGEVEGVLKKREAEESANAVEEASQLPAK
jgi:hypothetical protein